MKASLIFEWDKLPGNLRRKKLEATMIDEKDSKIERLETELSELREYVNCLDATSASSAEEMPTDMGAGNITGASIRVGDVTEQVQSSKNIGESEHRFQNLVRDATVGIVVLTGNEMKVEIVNAAYARLINLTVEDLIGKNLFDIIPDAEAHYLPVLNGVLETGNPVHLYDSPYAVVINGEKIEGFLNVVYQPYRNAEGDIVGVMVLCADVTQQVIDRKKIEESENYFRRLTDTVPTIIWITEPDGYCSYLNKHWYDYTGQTEKEGEGFGWLTATHPDDAAAAGKAFVKANTEQTTFTHVYRLRTKNGDYRWAIDKGSPKFSADGKYEGMIGTVVDIHEEKISAAQIKESEIKLQSLIAAAPIAIGLFIGRDLIIENPNQQFIEIVGKGPNIAGMRLSDAMPELVEHEQPYLKILDDVFTTGKMYQSLGDPVHIVRNGVMHHGFYNIYYVPLFDADGKVYGIMDIATDVTEQMQNRKKLEESEEQFSTLADNMENLAWLADGEGNIYWYNKRWYNFTGTTLEEMKGWGWQKVHHPDHVDRVVNFVKEAWHTNQPFEITFPLRRQDGEYKWFLTRAYPIANEQGKVFRWIGTNTDVDEQKKAEVEIKYRKALLEAHNESSADGILLVNDKGKIISFNKRYLEIWSLPQPDAENIDDEAIIKHTLAQLQNAEELNEKNKKIFEYPLEPGSIILNFKDGKIVERINYAVLGDDGSFYGVSLTYRDITQQKLAQAMLEYRKALLEAHYEASFDGLLLVDAQGKIISYNHRFVEIWNMPQQIVNAKNDEAALSFAMSQLVQPEKFIAKVRWLYMHPNEISSDILEFKDGKIVERHGYPVKTNDENYFAWSWTFRDITEQTNAQNRIRESEKQLRKTTEHFEIATTAAQVGTWSLDLASQTLEWTGLHKKMWGYDEQTTNLVYEDWHSIILPEDREAAFTEIEKALATKSLYEATYRIKRADNGEIRWIRSLGQYFFNERGKAVTLTGVSIDITQQKGIDLALRESEANFRLLADSMPQQVWKADANGNLNYYNHSVFSYSGLTPEQINKDGWLQIVHPNDREENVKQWIESVTTGKDFLFEHRFKRHDGEYRWQLSRAVPQKDGSGKITLWVGTSTDIQQQKEQRIDLEKAVRERTAQLVTANEQLEENNIALQKMNKELESFTYIASHDLQEPLRKIQTFANRIIDSEEQNLSATGKDYFRRMKNSSSRMQMLIEDLLAFSHAGNQAGVSVKTNLAEIVQEVIADNKEAIQQRAATVEIGKMCQANVIPFQFRQILTNLISNALKFSSHERTPRILIKSEIVTGKQLQDGGAFTDTGLLSASKNYCRISVADNGIGFEPEYSEKIFQIFQRLHAKEEYPGTGIGLSIVKKIVDNHKGFIKASGELNKGTRFDIYLPE